MKQIIIGIHGLGNKPSATILEDWWLKSIKEGLNNIGKSRSKIPFEMVYWADIIHELPFDLSITEKDNTLFEDEPYVKGKSSSRSNEPTIKAKVLHYIEEKLDKIFLNDDLSINFKNATDKLMHRYFSELDTYYCENSSNNSEKNCSLKKSIQNRLSSVLEKYKNYEILLVSHSMGTIVTFDILSKLSDGQSINTLITIGSPLGLPIIVGRIFAEQKLLQSDITKPLTPNCISNKWYNLSDRLDNIAIDHTLSDDYDANKFGVKAIDIVVFNNYEINDKPNPHKSYGYLRTPEIAEIFDTFLKRKRSEILFQKVLSISKSIVRSFNIFRKNKFKDSDES